MPWEYCSYWLEWRKLLYSMGSDYITLKVSLGDITCCPIQGHSCFSFCLSCCSPCWAWACDTETSLSVTWGIFPRKTPNCQWYRPLILLMNIVWLLETWGPVLLLEHTYLSTTNQCLTPFLCQLLRDRLPSWSPWYPASVFHLSGTLLSPGTSMVLP